MFSSLVTRLLRKVHFLCAPIFFRYTIKTYSWGSVIEKPLRVDGGEWIEIGQGVVVHAQTWLYAAPLEGKPCRLRIGNNSSIGYFNHLAAVNELIIGEHVVTANNVYIADNTHDYHNVNVPIMLQNVNALKPVRIGDGTWIGEHVCIIGASVGKQCVIGANAVVTNDIPDYSVAAGVPARIIKRYDFEQQRWVKVE